MAPTKAAWPAEVKRGIAAALLLCAVAVFGIAPGAGAAEMDFSTDQWPAAEVELGTDNVQSGENFSLNNELDETEQDPPAIQVPGQDPSGQDGTLFADGPVFVAPDAQLSEQGPAAKASAVLSEGPAGSLVAAVAGAPEGSILVVALRAGAALDEGALSAALPGSLVSSFMGETEVSVPLAGDCVVEMAGFEAADVVLAGILSGGQWLWQGAWSPSGGQVEGAVVVLGGGPYSGEKPGAAVSLANLPAGCVLHVALKEGAAADASAFEGADYARLAGGGVEVDLAAGECRLQIPGVLAEDLEGAWVTSDGDAAWVWDGAFALDVSRPQGWARLDVPGVGPGDAVEIDLHGPVETVWTDFLYEAFPQAEVASTGDFSATVRIQAPSEAPFEVPGVMENLVVAVRSSRGALEIAGPMEFSAVPLVADGASFTTPSHAYDGNVPVIVDASTGEAAWCADSRKGAPGTYNDADGTNWPDYNYYYCNSQDITTRSGVNLASYAKAFDYLMAHSDQYRDGGYATYTMQRVIWSITNPDRISLSGSDQWNLYNSAMSYQNDSSRTEYSGWCRYMYPSGGNSYYDTYMQPLLVPQRPAPKETTFDIWKGAVDFSGSQDLGGVSGTVWMIYTKNGSGQTDWCRYYYDMDQAGFNALPEEVRGWQPAAGGWRTEGVIDGAADGHVRFLGLTASKDWYFREVWAPDGWIADPAEYRIRVHSDLSIDYVGSTYSLVTDGSGKVVTTSEGHYKINNGLAFGYFGNTHQFLSHYNRKTESASFTIRKVGASGNDADLAAASLVAGSVFKVSATADGRPWETYYFDGTQEEFAALPAPVRALFTASSTSALVREAGVVDGASDGTILVKDLATPRSYVVEEVWAPSGYDLNPTRYEIYAGFDKAANQSFVRVDAPSDHKANFVKDELSHASTVLYVYDNPAYSYIQITKAIAADELAILKANGSEGTYSLRGTVYQVYRTREDAAAGRNLVASLTTGDQTVAGDRVQPAPNDWTTPVLRVSPQGTYWVKEVSASQHMELDPEPFSVEASSTSPSSPSTATQYDVPMGAKLRITKSSLDSGYRGSWDMSGATFAVYTDQECTKVALDAAGNRLEGLKIANATSDTSKDFVEATVLKGTYWVKETASPGGYAVSGEAVRVEATSAGDGASFTAAVADRPTNQPLRVSKGASGATGVEAAGSNKNNYSLAGAQYRVFASEAAAKAAAKAAREGAAVRGYIEKGEKGETALLTTKPDGSTNEVWLPEGTYWVVEVAPSPGFGLDTEVRAVALSGSSRPAIVSSREPLVGAAPVVQKVDPDTKAATPQGAAVFAGATFTLEHFDVAQGTQPSGDPSASATWTAGDAGRIDLAADDPSSGTWRYKDASGANFFPAGVYRLTETAAPTGYRGIGSVWTWRVDAAPDASAPAGYGARITLGEGDFGDAAGAGVAADVYIAEKAVMPTTIEIVKQDADQADAGQGDADVYKATFDVVLADDGINKDVVFNRRTFKPGSTVLRGVAYDAQEGAWIAEGLPYANYEIVEASAPEHYFKAEGSVKVVAGTASLRAVVKDEIHRQDLTVKKSDAETGDAVEATFTLTNRSKDAVSWQGQTYAVGELMASGETVSGQLTWEQLPYGTYEVAEASVDDAGFKRDPSFSASGANVISTSATSATLELHPAGGAAAAAVLSAKDSPVRGDVEVLKTSIYNEPLQGAVFTVYNASGGPVWAGEAGARQTLVPDGGEVCQITSGSDGIAKTTAGRLRAGTYTVRETKAPSGYEVSSQWEQTFTIGADGQVVSYTQGRTSYDPAGANDGISMPGDTAVDQRDPVGMPEAGQSGIWAAVAAGALVVALAAAGLVVARRRSKK